MLVLYDLAIKIYSSLIWLAAFNNSKAKAWISGRKNLLQYIEKEIKDTSPKIWFHFASLGEFEQGRSVIENLKKDHPDKKIVITFFSPSGYEIRKNYALADYVFYLPVDSKQNAKTFIELINPEIAIFTKYEYWYYYFKELKNKNIPLYIISAIFREQQPFFKWYGKLHREMLFCVTRFFVQNRQSLDLLSSLNLTNATLSGDTRFDRVYKNAQKPKQISEIEDFCGNSPVLIAGSSWLPDEKLLTALPSKYPDWKFIIAPHEIGANRIQEIEELFPGSIRFSNLQLPTSNNQTLIIDNIGMLSSLYQYAEIAYIGGGFGAGIHNTLEAAAFGLPVIFGPNYKKFKEAHDLINLGAAFSINNSQQLLARVEGLQEKGYRDSCGLKAKEYVENQTGATRIILKHILDQKNN
jgi:3-deoxy-D-manno-octulosonic-acid transferase